VQRRQAGGEDATGVVGVDDLVDVTPLGGHGRGAVPLGVLGLQLGLAAGPVVVVVDLGQDTQRSLPRPRESMTM